MKPKTVLHIIPDLNSGGCENQLLRLLPESNQFEHTVLTLLEEGSLATTFRERGITVISLELKSIFKVFGYFRIFSVLRTQKPDTVLTYLFLPNLLGKVLITPFSHYRPIPFLRSTYAYPSTVYRIIGFIEKLTAGLASQYLANSQAVKQAFVKNMKLAAQKITVIPNGIDTSQYKISSTKSDGAIICVANFHPNKGHSYLLEAYAKLKNPQIPLLLVGDGVEKANLEAQAKKLGIAEQVQFLGQRSDVPNLLSQAQLFVLPTLFEGMSNALMEAMAAGLPVIATDIEANKELVQDGENGLLVTSRNSQTLFQKIEQLMSDPSLRERLGKEARQSMQTKYDITVVAGQFETFLNSL